MSRPKKDKEITLPSSIKCIQPVGKRNSRDLYADNPFLEAFTVKVGQKSVTFAAGLTAVDAEGEKVNAAAISTFYKVDREEFIKIYIRNINSLFGISSTAQKVLACLLFTIQKEAIGIAHVYFSLQAALQACENLNIQPISQTIFTRGLNELIKAGFIADNAYGPGWFWINPNIIFNGDRIRFIEEYRLKREEDKINAQHKIEE